MAMHLQVSTSVANVTNKSIKRQLIVHVILVNMASAMTVMAEDSTKYMARLTATQPNFSKFQQIPLPSLLSFLRCGHLLVQSMLSRTEFLKSTDHIYPIELFVSARHNHHSCATSTALKSLK